MLWLNSDKLAHKQPTNGLNESFVLSASYGRLSVRVCICVEIFIDIDLRKRVGHQGHGYISHDFVFNERKFV